ncbi:MAG: hypothetical protein K2N78_02265 [Oscillospiraceae bacterium]|nr:hypothetical protein [Oscillospiraceae bacterium]
MKRLTKFLLTAGAAICLLTACGDSGGPMEIYPVGDAESEDVVIALDSILSEGEAMLTSIDTPTDEAVEAGLTLSKTYHYRQMEDPAALAARYIGVLRGEQGFTPIDGQSRELAEEPDLETLTGSMILAKKLEGSTEKKLFRVVVDWSEYAVAVEVAEVNGRILPPPEPEKEESDSASGSGSGGPQGTSMMDQLDYFKTLEPSKLGLTGSDMSEYLVYPQQGWVLVDGMSCREIMVYRTDSTQSINVAVGTFFMSSDLQHMFKKEADGALVVVDFN